VKVGKAKAKQQRMEDIVRGLEMLGITYDDEGSVYKYIGLHWKRYEKRLSLNEVLDFELK
jgi:hypothetical protein